jgi:nucleoside-diphosphate-sugar epimerase
MILLSGTSGFVGTYLQKCLSHSGCQVNGLSLRNLQWGKEISKQVLAIIHLAGKAHDLKNVTNPKEYYEANYELTQQLFDAFLQSSATVFVFMSSVKAAADEVADILIEEVAANPQTHYGKSKLLAEQYIVSKNIPEGKRVYILRPCMIHGPGNKGNLNLLYQLVSKGVPWPLAAFENQRSFCSIDNLLFVIKELIEREDIPSGIYNIADDTPVATNELIRLIAKSRNKKARLWAIPISIVKKIARIGDVLHLPLNSERLQKLTESYPVSNAKLLKAIGKPLPITAKEGLLRTFESFNIK